MPIAMERKLTIMGMFGLANNEKYQYPTYFQIQPAGPDPQTSTAIGFFELAAKQTPRPQTVAIVGADAEYPQNALVGARELIKKFGLKTVYDRTYPPSTVDYTPIVRAIKATNADIVFVASYPPDSVGMLRAAHEVGLQPKIFGGGMVGLQFTSVMTSMGPMLNGVVNYDFWAPEPTMLAFPGIKEFLKEYQARAEKAGVDPLGYYLPPYSYALVQVLGQAVEATKSLDQQKLADYLRATEFNTVVGKVKFGKNGEWAKGRTLMVQYQKVHGTGIDALFTGLLFTPVFYVLGAVVYRLYYESFERRGEESLRGLVFFFGVLFIIEVSLSLKYGVDYRLVEAAYIGKSIDLGGVGIAFRLLVPCLVGLAMTLALHLFLSRTFYGRVVMAVSQDRLALRLMGADPVRIKTIAFGVGIAAASLAGALLITIAPVVPSTDRDYIGRMFAITVLGGMGSIAGTLVAAVILGVAESLMSTFFGPSWSLAVSFGILLVALAVRPAGLLGR